MITYLCICFKPCPVFVANGVSENCLSARVYESTRLSAVALEIDVKTRLMGLRQVIDTTDPNSIVVSRSHYSSTSTKIGYEWTITFVRQNGDLNPLGCVTTGILLSTNTGGVVRCVVTEHRKGSLMSGSFKLGISYPNKNIGIPNIYNSLSMPWNIDASNMAAILSRNHSSGIDSFGLVTVSRAVYIPVAKAQKRWR
jgi:hypothetical protein